ncbi:hypothetical protein ACQEVF_57395 [Nonomuraea polychroma]|uniref:hypothetical protein n=1 Tax=Nonomuraea polychroma TaxID=46176 RepID=UPI003D94C564
MGALTQLGCPDTYSARITEYLGAGTTGKNLDTQSKTVGDLDGIVEVKWGRRLDDTSEATITIQKSKASPSCCGLWRRFQPWWNDLVLYRDGEKVWRGPVYRMRERGSVMVLEARDLSAWMDRRGVYETTYEPIPDNPDMARTLWTIIRTVNEPLTLTSPAVTYDFTRPNIAAIISYTAAGFLFADVPFTLSGLPTIRDAADQLVEHGRVDWGQHIDTIVVRANATAQTPSSGRLAQHDFATDLEVVVDGEPATTFAAAAGDIGTGLVYKFAAQPVGTPALPHLVTGVTFDGTATESMVADLATIAVNKRIPPVVYLIVPDGAQLAASAPVAINDLMVGSRFDVYPDNYCWKAAPNAYFGQATSGFRLSAVDVTWNAERGEEVQVTMIPLALHD